MPHSRSGFTFFIISFPLYFFLLFWKITFLGIDTYISVFGFCNIFSISLYSLLAYMVYDKKSTVILIIVLLVRYTATHHVLSRFFSLFMVFYCLNMVFTEFLGYLVRCLLLNLRSSKSLFNFFSTLLFFFFFWYSN